MLIPQLINTIFEETIEAMIAEIMAAGSVVMIGLMGIRDTSAESVVKAALGRRADAIIATRCCSTARSRAATRPAGSISRSPTARSVRR